MINRIKFAFTFAGSINNFDFINYNKIIYKTLKDYNII